MSDERPPLLPRRAWLVLFWALVAVVTVLMLMPHPPKPIDTGWDKSNHLLAFAAPTFAGLAMLRRWQAAAIAALCLGLLAWGASIEVLQSMLPPRQGDVADWLADAVGVAVGLALYAGTRRVLSRGRR
ncbi:MAG: VanZ family protein [Rubrivivax sp.]|nr:VanZ family protein [Rubrivivax sp.]MDH5338301.1 VanZ family protein [Rubrivivax sp.]